MTVDEIHSIFAQKARGEFAMVEEHSQIREVAKEMRPHFLWDIIKRLAEVLLFPVLYVIWQKMRQVAWDWWAFGGILFMSLGVLLLDRFVVGRPVQKKDGAAPTTFADGMVPPAALWNNSGNLFWLGHDLMYSLQVALRGVRREEVLRALRQSCYHLDHLGLRSNHIGHFLFDLRSMAEAAPPNDWNDAFRKKLATKIDGVIQQVGALAATNQKDFESDIRHSHGFDSH